jgi:ribosome-binding ATPase YchF (GTP1/OBG family)
MNNKKALLLLLFVFILPVILAKVALESNFFNKAATNSGELLNPVIDFGPAFSEKEPLWRLVYVVPNVCDAECENAIFAIQQVHTAMGKHSSRVQPVIITTEESAKDVLADANLARIYAEQQAVETQHTIDKVLLSKKNVNEMFKSVDLNGIFIVDTLNNGMLKHPTFTDKEEAVQASRLILSDVRKLLKLSRIG